LESLSAVFRFKVYGSDFEYFSGLESLVELDLSAEFSRGAVEALFLALPHGMKRLVLTDLERFERHCHAGDCLEMVSKQFPRINDYQTRRFLADVGQRIVSCIHSCALS
jgi:hypothetical protein